MGSVVAEENPRLRELKDLALKNITDLGTNRRRRESQIKGIESRQCGRILAFPSRFVAEENPRLRELKGVVQGIVRQGLREVAEENPRLRELKEQSQ